MKFHYYDRRREPGRTYHHPGRRVCDRKWLSARMRRTSVLSCVDCPSCIAAMLRVGESFARQLAGVS